jgi:hypothetical protein
MGIKIGKGWSSYIDNSYVSTIDPEGPMSLATRLLPLVSYTRKIGKYYKMTVALEFPQDVTVTFPGTMTESGNSESHQVLQSYPDIPITFMYDRGPCHFFVGYNQRLMKFSELGKKFAPHYTFSGQLSGSYSFGQTETLSHKIFLQGIHTYGMADCIQDLSNLGYNAIVSSDLQTIDLIHNTAFYAGYSIEINKKNQINFVYSYLKQWDLESLGYDDLYEQGHYAAVNYMREFLDYGTFGVEGLWGMKQQVGGKRGNNFRINLYIRYDF